MTDSPHIAQVVDECLDDVLQGRRTIQECLARYPGHHDELEGLLSTAKILREAPTVEPAPAFSANARQRLLISLPVPNESVTIFGSVRSIWQQVRTGSMIRRLSMTWILVLAAIASLVTGGGMVYAADSALPGDALYGLDRAAESVRLNLTGDPVEAIRLQLSFARERALEVQELARVKNQVQMQNALENLGDSIVDIAGGIESVEGLEREVVTKLLDEELDEDPDDQLASWCDAEHDFFHPVGEKIVTKYDGVTYEEVMGWFCEQDAGFGEIAIALGISQQSDLTMDDLFLLREEGLGWGEIVKDLDLIIGKLKLGKPEESGPKGNKEPGSPEWAGPKQDAPVNAGEGNANGEAESAGPPENAGPKQEAPVGPPDDKGKPDNGPNGPPDNAGEKGGNSENNGSGNDANGSAGNNAGGNSQSNNAGGNSDGSNNAGGNSDNSNSGGNSDDNGADKVNGNDGENGGGNGK